MLPLSNKISHDICNKSFYSSNDNSNDRLLHEEALSLLLTLNQDEYFSNELSGNAQWISNLYKMKLDFFGQTNLDIQHLKNTNDPDAAQLKNLENRFNDFPSELLREEINQVKTKIINYRMSNYKQLCEVQFNEVLRSIKKNELVIDLISYYNRYDSAVSYALNSSNNGITFSGIDINFKRESDLKNRKDVNSYFFNYIYENIPQITSSTENSLDTFYIIPSGKSNFINFSALSLSLENKLGREITVHVINSLADIPKIKKEEEKKIDDFILIGDIDFDKTANNSSKNLKNQTRGIQLTTSIKDSGIPFWGYLPGTKQEIESIERIALDNNINTLILREKEVTQSKLNNFLLDRNKNNVIHIATHGYFFPDNSEAKTDNLFASHQNPLLRSGLILSGANDNWNNKSLVGSHNDGILTAEEISFLDLSGVELVVLSACDTGLGDVSNLEGINGLQRAFKLAGAKKLIMSLWKVPDKETAEFFKHFYKFLLEDERSINESFRYTQKIMNEKYEPYYWASFVLLE
jgi:CHAT domain-containing protein